MKNGQLFVWEQRMSYPLSSFNWYVTCTHDITNIHFTNPVPVLPKQLTNG